MKKYFDSKGHLFDHAKKLIVKDIPNYDVLISGWGDTGAKYLGKHEKLCKKYICFIRSYEFWHNNLELVNWAKFDKVFFVNKFVMDSMNLPNGELQMNGVDLAEIPFREHKPGKKALILADVNFKKGMPVLVQLALLLPDFEFNIYGNVTSLRDYEHIRHIAPKNLFVRGYTKDINKVFNEHDYIVLTSPVEGNPNCMIEGMASGLKPVIHRFVGSEDQCPFYWDRLDEAVKLLTEEKYDSKFYRKWVEDRYDMWKIYPEIEKVLEA